MNDIEDVDAIHKYDHHKPQHYKSYVIIIIMLHQIKRRIIAQRHLRIIYYY